MEIITRYSALKSRARETRDYLKDMSQTLSRESYLTEWTLLDKATTALTQCANFLVFHDYYTVDQVKLVKANTCKKHLLCPFCAARRASKNLKTYEEKINTLVTGRSDLVPVMITFTVKNQPDLKRVYNHMKKSFSTLMQRRRINKHQGTHVTEMRKVKGAIASTELTYNQETNEWHPHIHMVALIDDYIDIKKLSNEWHDITGDSMIVDIRKVYKKVEKNTTPSDSFDLTDGLMEVFKYALKFADLPQNKLWEAYKFLKSKRLISSYGDLYGIQVPESLLDETLSDLPYMELFYTYSSRKNSYDLKSSNRKKSLLEQEKDDLQKREYEILPLGEPRFVASDDEYPRRIDRESEFEEPLQENKFLLCPSG